MLQVKIVYKNAKSARFSRTENRADFLYNFICSNVYIFDYTLGKLARL